MFVTENFPTHEQAEQTIGILAFNDLAFQELLKFKNTCRL
jgi:hypothetical protein